MKVFHAMVLLSISVFLARMTAIGHLLTDKHFKQILFLTIAVTLLYIVPIVYIARVSYSDSSFKQTEWDY
jgi:hypothetical protein